MMDEINRRIGMSLCTYIGIRNTFRFQTDINKKDSVRNSGCEMSTLNKKIDRHSESNRKIAGKKCYWCPQYR